MQNFLDDSNPNASAEYKALVRRLAQLLFEDTRSALVEDDLLGVSDLAQETVETSLDTTADLHTAIYDLCAGNVAEQSRSSWVSGLCHDAHDEWETKAQTTQDPTAWENEALWASAAYNLEEVAD